MERQIRRTPGGDNQDQTILQAFLNIVEFWPDWYPNLHEAFEWPRVQAVHFCGPFWPHATWRRVAQALSRFFGCPSLLSLKTGAFGVMIATGQFTGYERDAKTGNDYGFL